MDIVEVGKYPRIEYIDPVHPNDFMHNYNYKVYIDPYLFVKLEVDFNENDRRVIDIHIEFSDYEMRKEHLKVLLECLSKVKKDYRRRKPKELDKNDIN